VAYSYVSDDNFIDKANAMSLMENQDLDLDLPPTEAYDNSHNLAWLMIRTRVTDLTDQAVVSFKNKTNKNQVISGKRKDP
jgi:hypothetical protein